MQIQVSGHQVEVTSALREYVHAKFDRILRHFDGLLEAQVILGLEKLVHRAECTLKVPNRSFHADAAASDMYAAIDALADKLDRQIRQHKEKLTDHHRAQARRQRQAV